MHGLNFVLLLADLLFNNLQASDPCDLHVLPLIPAVVKSTFAASPMAMHQQSMLLRLCAPLPPAAACGGQSGAERGIGGRVQVVPVHMWFGFFYALAYLFWAMIYFAWRGRWVYDFLNWSNPVRRLSWSRGRPVVAALHSRRITATASNHANLSPAATWPRPSNITKRQHCVATVEGSR